MKGAGRARLLQVGVVALLAVVGAVSSGCAGTSATSEGTGGGTLGTTTEQTTPGPSESASLNSAGEPPDSTLAHDEKSVTGTLGSYCYDSVCTDAAGITIVTGWRSEEGGRRVLAAPPPNAMQQSTTRARPAPPGP